MKYTKEERIEIGRKIYEAKISSLSASFEFGISEESARRYRLMYEESAGIVHTTRKIHESSPLNPKVNDFATEYESMSKEELIKELMKARIREERLKKGYMVKGDGATAEYILLDSKNTK